MVQPGDKALQAAEDTVRDLLDKGKQKKSSAGRNAVLRAALANEPTDTLEQLVKASDETVVRYFVTVLADSWCMEDPRQTLEDYDRGSWTMKKTNMPHVEQVRGWLDSLVEERGKTDEPDAPTDGGEATQTATPDASSEPSATPEQHSDPGGNSDGDGEQPAEPEQPEPPTDSDEQQPPATS